MKGEGWQGLFHKKTQATESWEGPFENLPAPLHLMMDGPTLFCAFVHHCTLVHQIFKIVWSFGPSYNIGQALSLYLVSLAR
jgi:hypothetical protein